MTPCTAYLTPPLSIYFASLAVVSIRPGAVNRRGSIRSRGQSSHLCEKIYPTQDHPLHPQVIGKKLQLAFDALFRREGIDNPEEQSYNLRFSGFARSDPRLHRYVCWMYYQNLKKRDQLDLLTRLKATCKVEDGFAYLFEGKSISLDLLLSIDDFYSLLELVPQVAKEPIVVAELGAGWGRLGYVLCRVNPRLYLCNF